MHHNHTILVRRKHYGFSQGEFARLLGISQSALCRFEDGQVGKLRIDIVLALTVIFGDPLHLLLPQHYAAVEEAVMSRAAKFYQAIEGKSDYKSLRRRDLFDQMMRRATANHKDV